MYSVPGGYPGGYPQGPRSLHFRGKRPIPRLPELASSCARPAAALRDHAVSRAVVLEFVVGSEPCRRALEARVGIVAAAAHVRTGETCHQPGVHENVRHPEYR